MSNLTRRLRLDLATLLAAVTDEVTAALAPDPAGLAGSLQLEVTGLDLTLPLQFESTAGPSLAVRFPSRRSPQPGHPGSLRVRIEPAAEEAA